MLLPLPPNDCPTVGGLRALRVWPAANVVLPASYRPGQVQLSEAITLRDPHDYADIWFQPDSAGFREPQADDAQGDYYKPLLELQVLRDAPDLAEAIARLSQVRYVVAAYADQNGQVRLVGTPEHPLRFSADFDSGKRALDRNGYPLNFSGLTPARAPFYLMGLVPGPPPTRRAFSPGFNFGFH